MQSPRETIERFLAVYKPQARYLKSAELDFPMATGNFEVQSSSYGQDTGHLNAADLLICYNQLAYVLVGQAWVDGQLPSLEHIAIETSFQLEKTFIVGMDDIRFRKIIDPSGFQGLVKIDKMRKTRSAYFLQTHYDFALGSAVGNIDLAISLKVPS